MSSFAIQNKQTTTDIGYVKTNLSEQNAVDSEDALNISSTSKSSSTHVFLKYVSLIVFTLHTVIRTTLLRYASMRPGPRYIKSTFVFICEIQKTILSIFLVIAEERSVLRGLNAILRAILTQPWISLKICFIGLIYTIQNNFGLIAISNLDLAVYHVTDQLKILTTAIFTRILLNRRLNLIQWIGLILLFVGISIVQIEQLTSKETKKDVDPIVGFISVFIACLCSGFAGVYAEKIIKTANISLWIFQIPLAVSSIILSLLPMFILDGHKVKDHGIFYGYTKLIWISTIINSIGGLLVGLVIKYSDTILKGFASSISIVFSCIIAMKFFDFQLTPLFSIGASLVIFSIIIYSNPALILSIFCCKLSCKDKPVFV